MLHSSFQKRQLFASISSFNWYFADVISTLSLNVWKLACKTQIKRPNSPGAFVCIYWKKLKKSYCFFQNCSFFGLFWPIHYMHHDIFTAYFPLIYQRFGIIRWFHKKYTKSKIRSSYFFEPQIDVLGVIRLIILWHKQDKSSRMNFHCDSLAFKTPTKNKNSDPTDNSFSY